MFFCSKCDYQYSKWQGRCTECGGWGTLAEEAGVTPGKAPSLASSRAKPASVLALNTANQAPVSRTPSGLSELDRVLSGGLVAGSVTLLAGEPGIGKSTLVAQLAAIFGNPSPDQGGVGRGCYYVSGEESEGQVLLRFTRLGLPTTSIVFSNAVEIGSILAAAKTQQPSLLIIDSIQTMMVDGLEAYPGTPNAVRAATSELINYAKSSSVPVLIIGQVTKDGNIAGPKTMEHLVDTLLTLEGDPDSSYRILRSTKNRFGSTDEVGVFEMTETGMMAVANPSAKFLAERVAGAGSVVTCIMEGSRPFLLEVQALVDKSSFANSVRRTSGFDASRLQMLLAILSKHCNASTADLDVYVNIVGGIKITEKAADLAVAAAILSAIKNVALPTDAIVIGELGLGGEIRSVPFLDRRLKEASRLGCNTHFTPKTLKNISEILGK
jgi:DNA repair protein RadA/Sms